MKTSSCIVYKRLKAQKYQKKALLVLKRKEGGIIYPLRHRYYGIILSAGYEEV